MTELIANNGMMTTDTEGVLCGMISYMDELLSVIRMGSESRDYLSELERKGNSYKKVICQMCSMIEPSLLEEKTAEEMTGHELLGKGKILVIGGQELGVNVMQGIAKGYGFCKKDFEFVDTDKAKDFMDRIRRDGKYAAVIIGSCPHKTSGGAGYSSAVERLKQTEGMPITIDARNKSGKLKITKEAFKDALQSICDSMRMDYAC